MSASSINDLARPFKWTHEYLNELLSNSKDRILINKQLQKAFSEVDRADFIPPDLTDLAYNDAVIDIGWNENLDKPTTIALMLQLLDIKKGGRYLDIGTGTGYVAALMATAAGKRGQVISIERKQFLLEIARINLAKYPFIKNLSMHLADGSFGYKQQAPYDGIHVAASFNSIPEEIKIQLKIGGKLIAPQDPDSLVLIERKSVSTFKQTLHKSFFFAKISSGIA